MSEHLKKPLVEWTDDQLKATAYDELYKLEAIKLNIKALQDELARRANGKAISSQAPVEPAKPEVVNESDG